MGASKEKKKKLRPGQLCKSRFDFRDHGIKIGMKGKIRAVWSSESGVNYYCVEWDNGAVTSLAWSAVKP